jgi:hypothetical protein
VALLAALGVSEGGPTPVAASKSFEPGQRRTSGNTRETSHSIPLALVARCVQSLHEHVAGRSIDAPFEIWSYSFPGAGIQMGFSTPGCAPITP